MLYISARLHMHAVDTSPAHTCLQTCTAVVIIWQAQNGDPKRAYCSSKTPEICVLSDPYGAAILKLVLGHVR